MIPGAALVKRHRIGVISEGCEVLQANPKRCESAEICAFSAFPL